jgi:hypothetical protein
MLCLRQSDHWVAHILLCSSKGRKGGAERGGVDQGRHITAEIPLRDIVSHGFIPLSEQKGAHIKIQVYPQV